MATIPTVNDVIDQSGFGCFSFKLTLLIGMFCFLDMTQLSLPTIVSSYIKCQWNMTSLEASLVSSSVLLGGVLGASFFGRIGDLYGRKLAMYLSLMLIIYFNVLGLFTEKPVWYGLSRLFVGIGSGGSIANVVGYSSEFFPMKYRAKVMAVAIIMASIGSIYTSVMGYLVLNDHGWKVLLFLLLVPSLLLPLSIKWTPESVRYLQTSGLSDATEKIVKILARLLSGNGKMIPRKVFVASHENKKTKKGGILLLFGKKYRYLTFSIAVVFTTYMISYYGIVFLSVYAVQHSNTCRPERIQFTINNKYDMNNIYKFSNTNNNNNNNNSNNDSNNNNNIIISNNNNNNNSNNNSNNNNKFLYKGCHGLSNAELMLNVLLSLSEIPGDLLFFFSVDCIGRKWSLCFSYIYAAVVYSLQNFCLPRWFNIFLIFSGRAIISGSAIAAYALMTESFPTIVRTTGCGLCSSIARLMVMFVPILFQDLIYSSFAVVTLIFVVLNVVSFCICLTLSDTTGKELDDT